MNGWELAGSAVMVLAIGPWASLWWLTLAVALLIIGEASEQAGGGQRGSW